jgi:uncharacterized membrane protein
MPSPKNETLANMMRRMSTNSPVKKSTKTTKKTPVKKSTAAEKQKKRVESIVKLMEKDKKYTPWLLGSRPKGYKRPSTIDGSDEALNMHLAGKLFMKRQKAAEKKQRAAEAGERVKAEKERQERQKRYEAEKDKREQERKANNERQEQQKKAENLAMNTYARNLFNTLKKAKDQKSIRQAFMQGALKIHPNKGGNAELFKKFKAIYNGKKM